MAGKIPGNTRKSTSSKKATEKKGSTVTPIDQNVSQSQNSVQNGNNAGSQASGRSVETSSGPAGPELLQQIRIRAYELFEQRGRLEGFDQEDWAQAEAEILGRFEREKSA